MAHWFGVDREGYGDNRRAQGTALPVASEKQSGPLKEIFVVKSLNQRARYVEVRAVNMGRIPSWHKAAGQKAWLFVDEIFVNPERK